MTVHTGLRCMRHNAYLTCRLYKKGGDFKYCGRWQEGQGQEASQKMAQLAAEAAASCQPICVEQWLLYPHPRLQKASIQAALPTLFAAVHIAIIDQCRAPTDMAPP